MLFNTLSVFSSFSLSAYLKLPVHRRSGWNIPETAIKLEVSAGMPMNRGSQWELKERKEFFFKNRGCRMMVHFIQNRTSTFPVNSCQKTHETFHFRYLFRIFVREDLLLNRERNSYEYNPQNHLAADNKTTCLIFPLKQKTKRLKKRSKQHTKSVIQMLFKSHLNNTFYI